MLRWRARVTNYPLRRHSPQTIWERGAEPRTNMAEDSIPRLGCQNRRLYVTPETTVPKTNDSRQDRRHFRPLPSDISDTPGRYTTPAAEESTITQLESPPVKDPPGSGKRAPSHRYSSEEAAVRIRAHSGTEVAAHIKENTSVLLPLLFHSRDSQRP